MGNWQEWYYFIIIDAGVWLPRDMLALTVLIMMQKEEEEQTSQNTNTRLKGTIIHGGRRQHR